MSCAIVASTSLSEYGFGRNAEPGTVSIWLGPRRPDE